MFLNISLLSSLFHAPLPHLSSAPPPSATPLFLYKKGQASHGSQQSMTCQVEVRLSTSLCIQPERGNLVRGMGSQNPTQALGIGPNPTARSPADRASCTTLICKGPRLVLSRIHSCWFRVCEHL